MDGPATTILTPNKTGDSRPGTHDDDRSFTFDHSFWSHDLDDAGCHSQQHVYDSIGRGVLDNALNGFNACILAYGQTGSGKTYSMMGTPDQPGVIPRLCRDLFDHVTTQASETLSFTVEVSYLEIYNEQTFDLLKEGKKGNALRIRNHKTLGPYVEGLSQFAVANYESVLQFMESGNAVRTTAATKMNDTSSRSHSIFSLVVKQTIGHAGGKRIGEKVSKISLVDLAGSERQSKTGATGARLKEGSTINKSLTTLGMVIGALAERSSGESLGGNSKTVMIATVSPAAENYEESMSTLRYADRAKQIVNKAFVNEDATAAIVEALRAELEALRLTAGTTAGMSVEEADALRAEMEENERLLSEANLSWEEKLRATERELVARAEAAEHEAEQRQRENEALRREMDALQEAKEFDERTRGEALKAQAAEQIAELTAMEDKLHREKLRAEQLEASLATEKDGAAEELTRQRTEIEQMRRTQAELQALLQAKEQAVEAEREARLATEASNAAKAQKLTLEENKRREEFSAMNAEREKLVASLEAAKQRSEVEIAALKVAKDAVAAESRAQVQEEREQALAQRVEAEAARQLEIRRLEEERAALVEQMERAQRESQVREGLVVASQQGEHAQGHDARASTESVVQSEPTLAGPLSPESESDEKSGVISMHGLLGSAANKASTDKDILRAAESHERELATRRLEVERLTAEKEELVQKMKHHEAVAAQEKKDRIRKDLQLRETERHRAAAVAAEHRLETTAQATTAAVLSQVAAADTARAQAEATAVKHAQTAAAEAARVHALEEKSREAAATVAAARLERVEQQLREADEQRAIDAENIKTAERLLEIERAAAAAIVEQDAAAAAAGPAPVAPRRKASVKMRKKAKSLATLACTEAPELACEKSELLLSYLVQLDGHVFELCENRHSVNVDKASVLQGLDSVKRDSVVVGDKMHKIVQKQLKPEEVEAEAVEPESPTRASVASPTSPDSSKSLKIGLELQEIEERTKADIAVCESRVQTVMASAEKVQRGGQRFCDATDRLLEAAEAKGLEGDERVYLGAKCQQAAYDNDQVYRGVLSTAAEVEAVREGHQKNLDALYGLFSSILGVSSELDRERVVQAAVREREGKLVKRRRSIANLAQTPFGEPGSTKRVSLLKFLCDFTGLKKGAITEVVNVGELVLQGELFTPVKERTFDRWNRRKYFLDLRSRDVSWAAVKGKISKPKSEIELRDILTASLTLPEKISKKPMVRDDSSTVANTFAVVTQKRTWYFSASSKIEAELWVAVLQATCHSPDS